jgi:N-acetylmuramic acid 6-phosphate etherase
LLLGIDGGGTHTVALLAEVDGAILGRGEAGPSNLHAVSPTRALQALNEAVNSAFRAANLPRDIVAAACLGLAGADRSQEQALLRDWASGVRLSPHLHLTSDTALLLAAGTPNNCGLAIVAGTGSMAFGRSADGRTARAGGWGYLLGDEGSGYRITLAALQAVTQAADARGPATALTEAMLKHLQLAEPKALIQTIYQGEWDRAALAGLAPLVFSAAEAGDGVASGIIEGAAGELAAAAAAVARQLGWQGAAPLALAGGCLLANSTYRDSVLEYIHQCGVYCEPVQEVPVPAVGAVRLAQARVGA